MVPFFPHKKLSCRCARYELQSHIIMVERRKQEVIQRCRPWCLPLGFLRLAACSPHQSTATSHSTVPVRGGTLKIFGGADVDHLATTSAYNGSTFWFFRAFTRQLVSYAPSAEFNSSIQI